MANDKIIWDVLIKEIGNEYGVAGLIGNIEAESGLNPINMENQYEKKLGFTDSTYTEAVDNGTYTNFEGDSCGYGLCQWTYKTRKRDLLAFCKKSKKSVGDLECQLKYLIKELKSKYKTVYAVLQNATSVKEASDAVLVNFERPADQSENAKNYRASLGEKYYSKYANTTPKSKNELYRVSTPKGLNVRAGAGMNYDIVAQMTYNYRFEVSKKDGEWGYVPAKKGWCCLNYAEHA